MAKDKYASIITLNLCTSHINDLYKLPYLTINTRKRFLKKEPHKPIATDILHLIKGLLDYLHQSWHSDSSWGPPRAPDWSQTWPHPCHLQTNNLTTHTAVKTNHWPEIYIILGCYISIRIKNIEKRIITPCTPYWIIKGSIISIIQKNAKREWKR